MRRQDGTEQPDATFLDSPLGCLPDGMLHQVPLELPKGQCYDRLAVAPESSGGCIAASLQNSLHFLCPSTGKLLAEVTDAHHGGIIQMVRGSLWPLRF